MKWFRPRVPRFFLACTATATLLATAGCYFKNPAYPQEWPQLRKSGDESHRVTAQGCPDMNGLYDGWGYDESGKNQRKLEVALLGAYLCEWTDTLEIGNTSDTSIMLRAFRNGELCGEQEMTYEKDYWCSTEGLELRKMKSFRSYPEGAAEWEWNTRTFLKASDNSLILKECSFGTMIYLLPTATGETHWFRFKPIEKEP